MTECECCCVVAGVRHVEAQPEAAPGAQGVPCTRGHHTGRAWHLGAAQAGAVPTSVSSVPRGRHHQVQREPQGGAADKRDGHATGRRALQANASHQGKSHSLLANQRYDTIHN